MKRFIAVIFINVLMILLSGCASQRSTVPANYRWASVEGGRLFADQAGEEFYFHIFVDDGMIAEGIPIKIKLSGDVQSGSLRFEMRDPDGQAVWDSGTINPGAFSINTEYDLSSARAGTYKLGIVHSDNVAAVYDLGWHALKLGPGILLPGAGMILVSVAFVVYAARRRLLGWSYLGLGALFWVLTVTLKFAFAIPVNPLIFRMLGVTHDNLFSPGNLTAYFYIGALTGVFEAGLAYIILRRTRWGRPTWEQALVFGIGFGVIEALLLGLAGLFSALAGITSPGALPIPTLGNLARNATLAMGSAPVVERLCVVFAHIFACVLIFLAIVRGEIKWAWLAVLYKTLLDVPAGFASFWGVGTVDKLWTIEAFVMIFGLIGVWGTTWVARHYPEVNAASEIPKRLVGSHHPLNSENSPIGRSIDKPAN